MLLNQKLITIQIINSKKYKHFVFRLSLHVYYIFILQFIVYRTQYILHTVHTILRLPIMPCYELHYITTHAQTFLSVVYHFLLV